MSGLQCPIALWSGLRSENDPQPSTDTTLVQRGWEEKPERGVLMWRSAKTFTSGAAKSPADLSDKPHRLSLFDSKSIKEIIKSFRSSLAEFQACRISYCWTYIMSTWPAGSLICIFSYILWVVATLPSSSTVCSTVLR